MKTNQNNEVVDLTSIFSDHISYFYNGPEKENYQVTIQGLTLFLRPDELIISDIDKIISQPPHVPIFGLQMDSGNNLNIDGKLSNAELSSLLRFEALFDLGLEIFMRNTPNFHGIQFFLFGETKELSTYQEALRQRGISEELIQEDFEFLPEEFIPALFEDHWIGRVAARYGLTNTHQMFYNPSFQGLGGQILK